MIGCRSDLGAPRRGSFIWVTRAGPCRYTETIEEERTVSTDTMTLAAAHLLLTRLGVTPDELQWAPVTPPTFADYLPTVIAAAGPGARRTYGTYWDRILTVFADRRLDQVAVTDVEILMHDTVAATVLRRTARNGVCAAEHLLAALRAIYARAVADRLIPPQHNPAAQVRKPRRPPNNRRGLTSDELVEINHAAAHSGNDTALDTLLLRLHTETACRRRAGILLRENDIDEHWCLLRLREKNNNTRWQPASPTLTAALLEHRHRRGTGHPEGPLLRYRDGRPLSTRRYDHLWARLGHELPWITAQNITTHWLRHTTVTWVERNFGYGIARAYAGHTFNTGDATNTYIKANIQEIATALSVLTGEPHPLAKRPVSAPTPNYAATP
jgi:site-specific recombinase XerD